jgi:nucleoside-diphosphate-sugar epimerase
MLTKELFAAHRASQVRAVSVRASDLLGPHVTESLVGERFFGPFLAGKKVQLFADPDVPHSLSFVGDVGQAMVTVGAHDEALGRAWHAPNAPAVTLRTFAAMVQEETGLAPPLSYMPRPVTRMLLPVIGPAVPPMRGLVENLYVFYEPYVVDHSAYAAAFGDDATPLVETIRQTVAWARSQKDQTVDAVPAAHAMARS